MHVVLGAVQVVGFLFSHVGVECLCPLYILLLYGVRCFGDL